METEALMRLFDAHQRPLFRFAYRLTGSAAAAEDIVQECFLSLLRPGSSYDGRRPPPLTYLLGVVRNQASTLYRRREEASEVPEFSDPRSPETDALRQEVSDSVARAILRLPEAQREVLILAHYEQMPLGEIARVLELDLGAVKSRLQRARANLKEALAGYAPKVERKS